MTALLALATATIWRPPRTAPPPALEAALRHACAGAWRALEIMLAGDVLRGRLGRASDRRIKASVEAVLALLGPSAPHRTEGLTALRTARDAHRLDGDLDVTVLVTRCAPAGTSPAIAKHVEALQGALASDPALAAELGDPLLAALVVDIARELLHHASRGDASLAPWAIPPAADLAHRHAGAELAALLAAPAAVEELDRLIAVPLALDDNVQFTVYRPRAIEPQRWHPLLVFAHLAERRPGDSSHADPVDEVRRQAEAVLGDHAAAYQSLSQDSRAAIPADGELVLVPEIEGVEINPPSRSFLWLEPVHREEFRMRAGPELVGKTVRGRLTVFLGHLAIAELALGVRIAAAYSTPTPPEPTCARTYRRIFASYSHRDTAIVKQIEQYARALGDHYVRDCIHLRVGEVWNERLRQLIERADAFQLFWSWTAMHSVFVRQEYEHALALNRPSFVRPTFWEDPMPRAPGLPPAALERLHFQKIGIVGLAPRSHAPATEWSIGRPASHAPVVQRRPPTSQLGSNVCDRCGKENQDHYKFCLGCGAELTAAPKPGGDMGMMKTMMAEASGAAPADAAMGGMGPGGPMRGPGVPPPVPRSPTGGRPGMPPAGRLGGPAMQPAMQPPMGPRPGGPGFSPGFAQPTAAAGVRRCPSCGSDVPPSFRFCGTCGFRMDEASQPIQAQIPPASPMMEMSRARLSMTLIRPDGTEGGTHDLRPGENKLGRSFGPVFENDGYLSPIHVQLDIRGVKVLIRDLESLNGVFVKMTQEEELTSGQIIRIGQELLRFELIGAPEPTPDGTELMGSPNPGYWGKLTVIIGRDITGAAFPLLGESCTLGRERGDINFPDDGYVSGLHARVTLRDGRVFLADLGSSNGTFIKVNGERAVGHESFVLLGQQLFRLNLD